MAGLFSTSSWNSTSPAPIVLSAPSVVLIFLQEATHAYIAAHHASSDTTATSGRQPGVSSTYAEGMFSNRLCSPEGLMSTKWVMLATKTTSNMEGLWRIIYVMQQCSRAHHAPLRHTTN